MNIGKPKKPKEPKCRFFYILRYIGFYLRSHHSVVYN